MKDILVFATSVLSPVDVRKLKPALERLLQEGEKWNFDLGDCDHILRVETFETSADEVIKCLVQSGYLCAELSDIIPQKKGFTPWSHLLSLAGQHAH